MGCLPLRPLLPSSKGSGVSPGSRLRRYSFKDIGETLPVGAFENRRADQNTICKRPSFTYEAFPQAGGPTLEAGFAGLESCSGPGKRLWILGIAAPRDVCSSENAQ